MDTSFSSSISGMKSASIRHDITAHDIANVNTPGFEQSTPHQSEIKPQGTEISHISRAPNNINTQSNTDLAEESKEQIMNRNTFSANAKVIKVQDSMLGEAIDIVG